MSELSARALQQAADANGLFFRDHTIDQIVAALDSGKHIVLTGPPGSGKTTLAYLVAEMAKRSMVNTGFLPTTATSEWTSYETIGGLQPGADGLQFRPGLFVEAIIAGQWLVIDEMNRSNFDRAFGQLFTVLSGSAVVLPYKRSGSTQPVSLVPPAVEPPVGTDPIRVPAAWRIVATMNVFDKNLLFEMSYALMRRFAFIEVATPDDDAYLKLLQGPGELVSALLPLRQLKDLGPAVYLDASRYVARRLYDQVTPSRVLFEVFYSYFMPQFEGADDDTADQLFELVGRQLDPVEQDELRRVISLALGIDLLR